MCGWWVWAPFFKNPAWNHLDRNCSELGTGQNSGASLTSLPGHPAFKNSLLCYLLSSCGSSRTPISHLLPFFRNVAVSQNSLFCSSTWCHIFHKDSPVPLERDQVFSSLCHSSNFQLVCSRAHQWASQESSSDSVRAWGQRGWCGQLVQSGEARAGKSPPPKANGRG